jgi:hypothetical protein
MACKSPEKVNPTAISGGGGASGLHTTLVKKQPYKIGGSRND